jgi:beta-glucanase (GH16 family)
MAVNDRVTLFFDDFTSSELDCSKWNVRTTERPVNSEQQAYVDSGETIRLVHDGMDPSVNGALAIHGFYRPGFRSAGGETFDFISGRIDTRAKVEIGWGTISSRIKLPAGQGVWPAFWALGAGGWPGVGEIDVMENVGERDWVSMALHGTGYSGETPLVNRKYYPPGTDCTSWHVYSVEWTPSELAFRVDGELGYRVTRTMVEHYGPWAFDGTKYLILNLALGGTYPFKTNGAREPYFGIPQATLDLIIAGEAVMLVDWVKVEQRTTGPDGPPDRLP